MLLWDFKATWTRYYVGASGSETWQMCTKCDDHCCCRKFQLISEQNKNDDDSRSLILPRSSLSDISMMSRSSAPNLVYKRRKLQGNSLAIFSDDQENTRTGDYLSITNFGAPSVAAKEQLVDSQIEHETEATRAHSLSSQLCIRDPDVRNSESFNGCSVGEELVSDEGPKSKVQKGLEVNSVNDTSSSSKSITEHLSSSRKTEVDEIGECSSSTAIVVEALGDHFEKDLCISILRSNCLLGDVQATGICESSGDADTSSSDSCRRSCKICSRSGTTLKMLICDNCEDAFHMSCCHPRIKKVPIDEWFCHSCLSKKHKILKETVTRKSPNIMCMNASSKGQMNPILLMLRDTEPYRTSVRVGKGFQAEVPDWSGAINDDIDDIGEPLELDSLEYARLLELNCNKPSRHTSIANWLQCRVVIDHVNGIICGKWRRAPLFEVQTNDWECFCSILWDPSHADCNVPQELETDQVLKQLKYIETLRPRLSAKQHNLDRTKSTGDLQNPITDTKSVQTL